MKFDVSKGMKMLSTTMVIALGISSIAGAWLVYKNNIWRPKFHVDDVDFAKGIATVTVNGKQKMLYAGSTLWAGGDWGVRFSGAGDNRYNRIELVKNNMVHEIFFT